MHNELKYSLKDYLITQSVNKNHYPFKFWIRNKNLFIHLSFWLWIIWIFLTFFAIFLPVSNQQKLGRGAIIVFETVFQYIVRILGKHKDAPGDSVNISPPMWNYEAYLFMYLTVIIVILGGYVTYLIKNFLDELGAMMSKHPVSRFSNIKFLIFARWFRFLWVFCLLLIIWTTFALLYVRKPVGNEIGTFLYAKTNINVVKGDREYTKVLSSTGWATAGLNMFVALNIIIFYFKYSRELFKGNQFFFADLRMKEELPSQVFIDANISKAINESRYLSGKHDFSCPNTPGYVYELENVNKYFYVNKGVFHALKNINLKIKDGDFVVILGYSGSGKTTLLNLLAGIDRPTSGKCVISDCDTTKMTDYDLNLFRRKKVGYVFQNYALLPNLTASENIAISQGMDKPTLRAFVKEKHSQYKNLTKHNEKIEFIIRAMKELFFSKHDSSELNQMMIALDLIQHKDKYPHTLSGGQQQRVSIARALIKRPTILLADEPTGSVDQAMTKSILKLFSDVNKHAKTTVILITHNPLIAKMAKRVLYVSDGEIVKDERNEHPLDIEDIKGL